MLGLPDWISACLVDGKPRLDGAGVVVQRLSQLLDAA
jgi:hypothetical protein